MIVFFKKKEAVSINILMCNVKGVARSNEPTEALAYSLAKFFSNILFFSGPQLHFHQPPFPSVAVRCFQQKG